MEVERIQMTELRWQTRPTRRRLRTFLAAPPIEQVTRSTAIRMLALSVFAAFFVIVIGASQPAFSQVSTPSPFPPPNAVSPASSPDSASTRTGDSGNVACSAKDLPRPTGKYPVGTTVLPIEKLHGSGTMRQVQLWYPARPAAQDKEAMYVLDASAIGALRAAKFLDVPDCLFNVWEKMRLAAILDASVAILNAKAPLVMIAPGFGVPRFAYSFYAEQLASDGYIVATVDFAEGGFLMEGAKQLVEGPNGDDESVHAERALEMARHMSDILDEYSSKSESGESGLAQSVIGSIDQSRIAAMGHSLGGAAALDACASDKRIRGCIDLDGIAESPIAEQGIKTGALILRSHPDYSDADLARLHRDRAKWDAMGEQIKRDIAKLLSAPGPAVWVVSINGTGHLSYSDAPYTMPTTISQWGGTILAPQRMLAITTQIVERFLDSTFTDGKVFSVSDIPEATIQLSRAPAH